MNNDQNQKPKRTSALWSAIRNFLADISFIGDAGGDPLDFWRTHAPVARPEQEQQQQNRVRVVRGRDGINTFKFDKDIDHDRNEYDNGNGNVFQ